MQCSTDTDVKNSRIRPTLDPSACQRGVLMLDEQMGGDQTIDPASAVAKA